MSLFDLETPMLEEGRPRNRHTASPSQLKTSNVQAGGQFQSEESGLAHILLGCAFCFI